MEKKCRYCAMMIPKEAKICPHCRKKQKEPVSSSLLIIIALIAAIGIISNLVSSISSPSHPSKTPPAATQKVAYKYSSKEHLDLARKCLAGAKPNKDIMKKTWGDVTGARAHLAAIHPNDQEYAEAQSLLIEVVRREKEISRASAILVNKLAIRQREEFASSFESNLLSQGLDVTVRVSGPDKRTIKIEYILMGRPLVHKLVVEGDMLEKLNSLGFTRAILTDGYDKTWNFDIKKILSSSKK